MRSANRMSCVLVGLAMIASCTSSPLSSPGDPIDEAPRRLVVAQIGFQGIPNGLQTFANSASGEVAPLQQISGPHTELSSPRSISVVENEVLVADQGSNQLAFYLATAQGDAEPARRIAGPSTTLVSPINAVVSGAEIYTLQSDGRTLVFPAASSGNVRPRRSFRADAQFMAVDRGEIYLRTTSDDGASLPRILVFPASATGAPQPSRAITGMTGSACPGAVAVRDQEVFVTDSCGAIYVFPASADGNVSPLRVIRGSNTQLDMPQQIALSGDEIYVVDQAADQVVVFPIQGDGDIAPLRVIGGPQTGIAQPMGIAVF